VRGFWLSASGAEKLCALGAKGRRLCAADLTPVLVPSGARVRG
jgi:hypothetical protein